VDPLYDDVANKPASRLDLEIADYQRCYANELETYLVARASAEATTWRRDYSSVEAYLASVEGHRQRWGDILGRFDRDAVAEPEVWTRPFHEGDDYRAEWVFFEFLPGVVSRAVVALPKGVEGKPPVVICQHGLSCSPFHVFGWLEPQGLYGSFATALARAGFAVVAPVVRTTGAGRNRLERIAHVCGTTLLGLECFKLQKLIDYVETLATVDASRLGMAGLSLGGTCTLLFTPLVERVKAACVMAFFNHRRKKMVVIDPRYSCYLATTEEHLFIPGWLPEFSDSDLASLICPRPLMVQTGKADGVSWWPFVLEEWERAASHYEQLGLAERAELVLHDGGHEVIPSRVVEFFTRWL